MNQAVHEAIQHPIHSAIRGAFQTPPPGESPVKMHYAIHKVTDHAIHQVIHKATRGLLNCP